MRQQLIDKVRNGLGVVASKIGSKSVRAYWWNRGVNFGDLITPYLLKQYGFTPYWAYASESAVISTGSILQHVERPYDGVILGSGFIDQDSKAGNFSGAKVKALRGRCTADKLGIQEEIILGDPGLLCRRFVDIPKVKKWKVGIVPHFVDWDHSIVSMLSKKHAGLIKVIDVQRQPMEVWQELAQCETVISSSLHGIVCSDALGIPTCWMQLSDKVIGDGFKFKDYFSAFDEEFEPMKLDGSESIEQLQQLTTLRDKNRLIEKVEKLDELFSRLSF